MSVIASAVLGIAAEACLSKLTENVTGELYQKLKGDPVKKAYKHALGTAVRRYATGERLPLARPLLDRKGILADSVVAAELAQLLRWEREPNTELIGQKWQAALNRPPTARNFSEEARLLVSYLEQELRSSDVFRPVFEARDLNAIKTSEEQSVESLANIEAQLEGLTTLLDARFGALLDTFARSASSGIRNQIRDFTLYLEEKTRGFVGRQWVFNAIERFIDVYPSGYFYVIGEPGIGKSALAAQWVKQHGYVHHFNIRAEGINRASTFLANVCAQLIAAYELDYTGLPPNATDDANFLIKLLGDVSDKLASGERCVIAVDALDEVDRIGIPAGANLLCLPLTVPKGVYIVATMQPDPVLKPRVDGPQDELVIAHDSSQNLTDVADFLQSVTARPGIQAYLAAQKIEPHAFVVMMVRKSEGNFMYLHHVIPEIERGAYKDLRLDKLPKGLQGYYEDHWRRMRGQDEEVWFKYKLPVIIALTVVPAPVSLDLISDFSKVDDRRRIRAVLQEWTRFLHFEDVEYEGGLQRRYRLYHGSFFQFIAAKQEIADERVDLTAAHRQIADELSKDLFVENPQPDA